MRSKDKQKQHNYKAEQKGKNHKDKQTYISVDTKKIFLIINHILDGWANDETHEGTQ